MIDQLLTVSIDLYAPTFTEDAHGNQVASFDEATSTTGWISHTSTSELLDNRDGEAVDAVLFLRSDEVITGDYEVESGDRRFRVVGSPLDIRTPSGPHHIEAKLREVNG